LRRIFHPATPTPETLGRTGPDFPVVLLGEGPVPERIDRVMIDNVGAATEAVEHLVAAGRAGQRRNTEPTSRPSG